MLSHANLKYQLDNLGFFLSPRAGERSLSLLPPWHIYERSCGYFLYSRACTQVGLNSLACSGETATFRPGPCIESSKSALSEVQCSLGAPLYSHSDGHFFGAGVHSY